MCEKLVQQGWYHRENIVEYYRIINKAAYSEFTEDSKPALDDFLKECHEESLKYDAVRKSRYE